jgi:hypothetical protein
MAACSDGSVPSTDVGSAGTLVADGAPTGSEVMPVVRGWLVAVIAVGFDWVFDGWTVATGVGCVITAPVGSLGTADEGIADWHALDPTKATRASTDKDRPRARIPLSRVLVHRQAASKKH